MSGFTFTTDPESLADITEEVVNEDLEVVSNSTLILDSFLVEDNKFAKWILIVKDSLTSYTNIESLEITGFSDGILTTHNVVYISSKEFKHTFLVTTDGINSNLQITNNETFSLYVTIKRYENL